MIILAVVIGYVLGVTPFLFFYILNNNISFKRAKEDDCAQSDTQSDSQNEAEQLLDEWLNGEKEETDKEDTSKNRSVMDIYNEFLTGKSNGGTE